MDDRRRIVMIETLTVDGGSTVTTPVPRQRFQLGNHLDSAALEVDEDGALITYEEYHPLGATACQRSGRACAPWSRSRVELHVTTYPPVEPAADGGDPGACCGAAP